jgi:hypothetical protein
MNRQLIASYRNLAFYAGTMALAAFTGVLTAYGWNLLGFFVVLILIGFLLLRAFLSLEFSLLVLLLSFVLVDPVRRVFSYRIGGWDYIGLLVIDIVLVVTILSLYRSTFASVDGRDRLPFWRLLRTRLPAQFKFFLALFIGWVILELFNPYYPSLLLSLAAVREYLLAVPILGLGWYVGHYWNLRHWQHAYQFMLAIVVGIIGFSLVQIVIEPDRISGTIGALLVPTEHPVHSWGHANVRLTSSVFASSKRYGRFLLMVYPLLWAYLRETKRRHESLISLLIAIGCFVSGSREAIFLFFSTLVFSERPTRFFIKALVLAIGVWLILYGLLGANFASQRLFFVVSSPDAWLNRLRYMTLYPVFRELCSTFNPSYIWGLGASRAGQATQLLGQSAIVLRPMFTEDVLEGGVVDSGLLKILTELGLIGLLLFLLLQGYILWKAWPWQTAVRKDVYALASGVAIVLWFVLFTKAHTVMSDQIMNIFFWFYVGLLFSRRGRTVDDVSKGDPETYENTY